MRNGASRVDRVLFLLESGRAGPLRRYAPMGAIRGVVF